MLSRWNRNKNVISLNLVSYALLEVQMIGTLGYPNIAVEHLL